MKILGQGLVAFALSASCACLAAAPLGGKTPDGKKVASGALFDIHVVRKESKPWVTPGASLNVFEATIVIHRTSRDRRQLITHRKEVVDVDLLDAAMWQVGDLDGDGLDDYRSVEYIGKNGCRRWSAQIWLAERKRFTFAPKLGGSTSSGGKAVAVCS